MVVYVKPCALPVSNIHIIYNILLYVLLVKFYNLNTDKQLIYFILHNKQFKIYIVVFYWTGIKVPAYSQSVPH